MNKTIVQHLFVLLIVFSISFKPLSILEDGRQCLHASLCSSVSWLFPEMNNCNSSFDQHAVSPQILQLIFLGIHHVSSYMQSHMWLWKSSWTYPSIISVTTNKCHIKRKNQRKEDFFNSQSIISLKSLYQEFEKATHKTSQSIIEGNEHMQSHLLSMLLYCPGPSSGNIAAHFYLKTSHIS